MGILLNSIEKELKIDGIEKYYKNNTITFFNFYKGSNKDVLNIPLSNIQNGLFYFIHYRDDSNWIKYSPVFIVDYKKFDNLLIINAVNFNFIPLEIRPIIFDKLITQKDIENNRPLNINYESIYKILFNIGYEYALMEYNLSQIAYIHRIDMKLLHKFLYSGHPINKYDPIKLYSIWKKKIETKKQRHEEMMNAIISDFYKVNDELSNDYSVLKNHADRILKSYEKYGK